MEQCGGQFERRLRGLWQTKPHSFDCIARAKRIATRSEARLRCSLAHIGLCGVAGSRGGGAFSRLAGGPRSGAPHFLLSFDELAIIPDVEIEQGPARRKVLDESHADRVSGAGRQHRHRNCTDCCSNDWHALYDARGSYPTACRDHRSCQAGYDRFASVFGKRNAINLRNEVQHLNLEAADGRQVDERHRNKSGSPRQ